MFNIIQQPGEPRSQEHHLVDVRPKKFKLHKFIKDNMTGWATIYCRIFGKSTKKLKMKSQYRKNVVFGKLL